MIHSLGCTQDQKRQAFSGCSQRKKIIFQSTNSLAYYVEIVKMYKWFATPNHNASYQKPACIICIYAIHINERLKSPKLCTFAQTKEANDFFDTKPPHTHKLMWIMWQLNPHIDSINYFVLS